MPTAALPIPDADAYVSYADVTGTGPLAVSFPLPTDWQGSLKCAVDGVQLAEGQFLFSPDTAVEGGFPSGNVTLVTAVAAATVELWRDTPISRTADYGQGPLDLDAFNTELARLTMQVQDARLKASLIWHSGSGAPAASLGGDGDMYVDTASGDLYGPKLLGAWGSPVSNLKGPQGDVGLANANLWTGVQTFQQPIVIPDEAYGALWNGKLEAPTKNAVFDEIETVAAALLVVAGIVADGDKGDITLSAGGTSWTIDNDAVTNPMLRNSAALSVIGRSANSIGDPADIVAGANDRLLARTGDALGFVQLTVGMIADAIITFAKLATAAVATATEFWSNTASKLVSVTGVWAAADPVTLTFSATQTLDFGAFINAKLTLTGNTVLQTPTNLKKGQSGCIELIQDATGSRTMDSTNSAFVWAGADGVLSTAANARDLLFYQILDDDKVFLTLRKAVA